MLGWSLIAVPFLVIAVGSWHLIGFKNTVLVFAFSIAMSLSIIVGVGLVYK